MPTLFESEGMISGGVDGIGKHYSFLLSLSFCLNVPRPLLSFFDHS